MSNLYDMLVLLLLGAAVGTWMKLSAARERAVQAARTLCQQHDLQLLDETVGLRQIRLRRIDGLRRVERCYDFEVSIDGNDREPGRLWMIGGAVTNASLPAKEPVPPAAPADHDSLPASYDNVVMLSSRRRSPTNLH